MLKAGFIGFGTMVIAHFSILNTHLFVEIVMVFDQSNTMLNIPRKYVDIKIYSDYRKMLKETTIDFVTISEPILALKLARNNWEK